ALFFVLAPLSSGNDEYIPVEITTVMLVAVTATPLRPLQTLAVGLSIGAFYFATSLVTLGSASGDHSSIVFTVMLTMLCTALSAVVYDQRTSIHKGHQEG